MDDVGSLFEGQQIPPFDREYISFSEVLFRLTGNAMYKRCENVIAYSENLIRALEDNFAIAFVGELRQRLPRMFVHHVCIDIYSSNMLIGMSWVLPPLRERDF